MKQIVILMICGLTVILHTSEIAGKDLRIVPHEQIYVHTDRDYYVAGETMFFQSWLYNLDKQNTYSGPQSQFAYLALRNQHGIVETLTIKLNGKHASGSIFLHDTLSTGMYELLGYTNWMRNLGEEAFFSKELFVANRFDEELHLMEPLADPEEDLEVIFAVEGGVLLSGHPANILIHTRGDFDTSYRNFHITSAAGDTIAAGRLNAHGFNTVQLHPDSAGAYTMFMDGTDQAFDLPGVRDNGLGLTLSKNAGPLQASIMQNGLSEMQGRISLQHRDQLLWEDTFHFEDGAQHMVLPPEHLPHGCIKVTIQSHDGQHKAKRYWYHRPENLPGVNVLNKNTFTHRDKVQLRIVPELPEANTANVSVSVRQKKAVNDHPASLANRLRNITCASDLDIDQRLAADKLSLLQTDELNKLLIGFEEWKDQKPAAATQAAQHGKILMEDQALILSGKVTDAESKKRLSNTRVLLNTPDTLVNLKYARTGDDGRFHFLLSDYYRDKELFLTTEPGTTNNTPAITTDDKFDLQHPFQAEPGGDIWQRRSFIRESQDIVTIQKTFETEWIAEPASRFYRSGRPPVLYRRPNRIIHMDDFFPLDDLHEIARELVPVWRIRGSEDDLRTSLVCHNSGNRLPGQPVFFLDGILVHDFSKLTGLGSREIDKIEIHNLHWTYGEMTFPGIIGIFTGRESYQDIFEDNNRYMRLFHESYRHHKVFDPPTYDQDSSVRADQPDMRQLLIWEPQLKLHSGQEKEVSFYTGDLSGDFLITIEGITETGDPIFFTKPIRVK